MNKDEKLWNMPKYLLFKQENISSSHESIDAKSSSLRNELKFKPQQI